MSQKPLQQQTGGYSRAHRAWLRLCTVCLAVYIGYIAYFAHSSAFVSVGDTVKAVLIWALLSTSIGVALRRACRLFSDVQLRGHAVGERIDLRMFALALLISLGVFGCAFAACYPGGVNYDISNQWQQAHTGEFNNWHPLAHTLLIWGLVQIKDSYPFVLLCQVLAFSTALAYLTAIVHKRGVPAWLALAVELVVALSAPVRNTLMTVGKDSAMTTAVLLLTAWAIELLYTRGAWLKKPLHVLLFGAALAAATLLRHNGMMWTYVLIAAVWAAFKACRKQAALAAGVMAALLLIIQGPVYGALNVVYPDNFVDESMGIPMTILGDIKQAEPDKLDEETTAFLATLATDEQWQTVYQKHNYNSIKFTFDREYVARRPLGEILGMTARAALAAPRTAFEAVNGLTDLVWDIMGKCESVRPVKNSGDIEEIAGGSAWFNGPAQKLLDIADWVMNVAPLRWLTQNIGVQLLLLLLVTLWALHRSGPQVLVLTLPLLLYCLGTMMLLASNDARFFQCMMATALPMLVSLLVFPKRI